MTVAGQPVLGARVDRHRLRRRRPPASTPTTSCATPTSRCTARRRRARARSASFTPDMHPNALTKAPSRDEILAALDAGEFVAHYQPIVAVGTGEVVAAEALVRWNHPRHGLLSPGDVRPRRRGHRARSPASTARCSSRPAARPPRWTPEDGYAADAAVHVNLSGEGLRTSELVGVVEEVLARTGLAPRRLVLELTESVLIAEMPTAQPDAGRAARARRPDRARRLRHRLLLARLPALAAGRHPQGRQAVRRRRRAARRTTTRCSR